MTEGLLGYSHTWPTLPCIMEKLEIYHDKFTVKRKTLTFPLTITISRRSLLAPVEPETASAKNDNHKNALKLESTDENTSRVTSTAYIH